MDLTQTINSLLMTLPVLIFSLSVHEAAHAYAALHYGDTTARDLGRITLNPVAHVDIIGTLLIPLISIFSFGFALIGWAKPVPINPYNLRDYRRAFSVIALAGPVSNILLSFVFLLGLMLVATLLPALPDDAGTLIYKIMSYGIIINVALAVFNMIPIPPLDGSKVVAYFLSARAAESYLSIGAYGFFIIIVLINVPLFSDALDTLIGVLIQPYFFVAASVQSLL